MGPLVGIIRGHGPSGKWRWTLPSLGLGILSTVPLVVAGVSLVLGAGGGLYWVLGELVVGFAVSIYYAWVLLIEILR